MAKAFGMPNNLLSCIRKKTSVRVSNSLKTAAMMLTKIPTKLARRTKYPFSNAVFFDDMRDILRRSLLIMDAVYIGKK